MHAIWKLARGQDRLQPQPCMATRSKRCVLITGQEFGGPRELFFANIKKVLTPNIQFEVIERDFRAVDYNDIGSFNIYLFDGPHEEKDQYDGIMIAQPALINQFILIVDDWNWRQVRLGTFQALLDARCRVEASIDIRTTRNNTHPALAGRDSDWHNGYFIGVVNKTRD